MAKFTDISEELGVQIIKLYQEGLAPNKIGVMLERSTSHIATYLKHRGIPSRNNSTACRKYKLNENYFETIDTEHKAYFLGLLYADGCNHLNRTCVSLELQEEDSYLLETFSDAIYLQKRQLHLISSTSPNIKNRYRFVIAHKKISEDLHELGCVPRKTFVLKFPTEEQVPSHLIKHFIRGYFDGDGSIGIYKNDRWLKLKFNILGTFSFLQSLQEVLINCCDITKNKISTHGSVYSLTSCNRKDVKSITDFFYKDATIYMERKYKIMLKSHS